MNYTESPSAEQEPAQTDHLPDSVKFLITDYGKYLGIEDFAFDEENHIALDVDGVVLTLDYVNPAVGILFGSEIAAVPAVPELSFFTALNASNHLSVRSGVGSVTMNPDSGAILWCDHQQVDTLTVEMLDEAVKRASRCVLAWQNVITEILDPSAEDAATDTLKSPELHFIKL